MKQYLHSIVPTRLQRYSCRCVMCLWILMSMLPFGKSVLLAQQDPQYSQYMFNQLAINPAYAGSKEAISTSIYYRNQWTGISGTPKTETFSIHSPMRKKKVAVGFNIIADQIGPKSSIGVLGSYAYRIKIRNGKLSLGLRAGIYQYDYNWQGITHKDAADPIYLGGNQVIVYVPTADAGAYYYTNTMFAGFSAAHLDNGKLTSPNSRLDEAQLKTHFFLTGGKAFDISDKLIFSPSVMVKRVAGAPISADLNFSFLLQNRLWLGMSLRSRYGVVAYAQVNITDKFKIGYAFDFGINKAGRNLGTSHEIMISYDFRVSSKTPFFSPRYF